MRWKIFVTLLKGKSIDKELCNIIDYIMEENLTYRKRFGSLRDLTNKERMSLSKLARKITRQNFDSICTVFKPETVLGWYKKILRQSHTFKGKISKVGRPSTLKEIERKLVKIAQENRLWGYGKLRGSLRNLGHEVSPSTIRNILRRNGIPPIKDRMKRSRWLDFIAANKDVMFAGDFFTADILTFGGVKTYFVLFFIHIGSRKVHLAGITQNPNSNWIQQIGRNMTMEKHGFMNGSKYLILDRDSCFTANFKKLLKNSGITVVQTSIKSPDMNAYAERWIRSIREECLDHLILLREKSLWYAVDQYILHYNQERNHQGLDNELIGRMRKRRPKRLGGLLRYYGRDVA